MPKNILFVTVLLLIVSVQALAVSCDLRCSMMGASAGGHALQTDMQMPHCQGMSMEREQGASLTANNSCATTTCGTELKAIVKSADQSDASAGKLLISAGGAFDGAFVSRAAEKNPPFPAIRPQRRRRTPAPAAGPAAPPII